MSDEIWNVDRDELRILIQKAQPALTLRDADVIINDWTNDAKKFRGGETRLGGIWSARSCGL